MKYKSLSSGIIRDKDGNEIKLHPGKVIDIKKKDFDFDFDEHEGFERAGKDKK